MNKHTAPEFEYVTSGDSPKPFQGRSLEEYLSAVDHKGLALEIDKLKAQDLRTRGVRFKDSTATYLSKFEPLKIGAVERYVDIVRVRDPEYIPSDSSSNATVEGIRTLICIPLVGRHDLSLLKYNPTDGSNDFSGTVRFATQKHFSGFKYIIVSCQKASDQSDELEEILLHDTSVIYKCIRAFNRQMSLHKIDLQNVVDALVSNRLAELQRQDDIKNNINARIEDLLDKISKDSADSYLDRSDRQQVRHPQFGKGYLISRLNGQYIIEFDDSNYGRKAISVGSQIEFL